MLEPSGRGRPGFADYLRVIRRGPRFWWSVVACVAAFTRLAIAESATTVLLALAIGVGLVVLYFPLWRRRRTVTRPRH